MFPLYSTPVFSGNILYGSHQNIPTSIVTGIKGERIEINKNEL